MLRPGGEKDGGHLPCRLRPKSLQRTSKPLCVVAATELDPIVTF